MKKFIPVIISIILCLGVAFILPHTGTTYQKVDDTGCLECHVVEDLHSKAGHTDCTQCHEGTPGPGTVSSSACIECHPLSDPGKCNLVNFHDPDKGGTCLDCHSDCGQASTTTTVEEQPPCPAEEIYGENSEEVEILRDFRDNVLSQTPQGRELIKQYYKWSPVIVKAMQKDPNFKQQVKERIDAVLEVIKAAE